MANGMEIIEQVHGIIDEQGQALDGLRGTFPDEALAQFTATMESAAKWVKLCRRKVWLRGKQGTEMAQGCLDAANRLIAAMDNPAAANEAAADLAGRLEELARLLATKVQVLT